MKFWDVVRCLESMMKNIQSPRMSWLLQFVAEISVGAFKSNYLHKKS